MTFSRFMLMIFTADQPNSTAFMENTSYEHTKNMNYILKVVRSMQLHLYVNL